MGIPVTTKLLAVSLFGEGPESEQFRQDVSAGKASMVTKTAATSNGLILFFLSLRPSETSLGRSEAV